MAFNRDFGGICVALAGSARMDRVGGEWGWWEREGEFPVCCSVLLQLKEYRFVGDCKLPVNGTCLTLGEQLMEDACLMGKIVSWCVCVRLCVRVCELSSTWPLVPPQVRKEYSKCFRQSQCCGALPPEGPHSSAKAATSRSTARYSSATQVRSQVYQRLAVEDNQR